MYKKPRMYQIISYDKPKSKDIYLSLLKQNREIPSAFKKFNNTVSVKNVCRHLNNRILDHQQRSLIYKLVHQAYPFLINPKKINKTPSDICPNCSTNKDNLKHIFLCTLQSRLIAVLLIKIVNKITNIQNRLSTMLDLTFKYAFKKKNDSILYIVTETIEYILDNGVYATLNDYKNTIKTKFNRLSKIDHTLQVTLRDLLD